ncbi:MAG: hypothetical protein EOM25_06710 [Deltaproteobacteria bacterium]|nr:hypothetical protein [Deltaproteobacteria bacterium]
MINNALAALYARIPSVDASDASNFRHHFLHGDRAGFAAALASLQAQSMQAGLFGDDGNEQSDSIGDLVSSGLRMEMLMALSQVMQGPRDLPRTKVRSAESQPDGQEDDGQPSENQDKAESFEDKDFGLLSRRFESGSDGGAAIGYDKMGGTSYGAYQISSAQGTMDRFLKFLDAEAPEWAARLRAAGPADTGSDSGAMPDEWRKIAGESGPEFEAIQRRFIESTHVRPLFRTMLDRFGLDESEMPPVLVEALFSTAVQHGPGGAFRLVETALAGAGLNGLTSAEEAVRFVQELFDARRESFPSSTPRVRQAVLNRLNLEEQAVLASLPGLDALA